MFAFGLYDSLNKLLFLARDRAGEKPLFYRYERGTFSFASELKALMADPAAPRVLNPDGLTYYLAYGFVPGEGCILKGYHKLRAAHALTLELHTGNVEVWPYWQLPEST